VKARASNLVGHFEFLEWTGDTFGRLWKKLRRVAGYATSPQHLPGLALLQ
jgi:hypothetical protein